MKVFSIILVLVATSLSLLTQAQRIYIHVIDEDLQSMPAITIFDRDTLEIAKTNMEGQAKFDISAKTKELLLASVGMEWTTIELKSACDTIEIVMMNEWIYDFITLKKVDRKRLKRFKKLPELHQIAYEKGIFSTLEPCYNQKFVEYYTRKNKIVRTD